jgi:hypothetical protein
LGIGSWKGGMQDRVFGHTWATNVGIYWNIPPQKKNFHLMGTFESIDPSLVSWDLGSRIPKSKLHQQL